MSKKFLTLDNNRVMLIHNMPFDPVNGLGKSEQELNEMGLLVEDTDIPQPEQREGFFSSLYYDKETKKFHYEYAAIPRR